MEENKQKSHSPERIAPQPRQPRPRPAEAEDSKAPESAKAPEESERGTISAVAASSSDHRPASAAHPSRKPSPLLPLEKRPRPPDEDVEEWEAAAVRRSVRRRRHSAGHRHAEKKPGLKIRVPWDKLAPLSLGGLLIACLSGAMFLSGYQLGHKAGERAGKKEGTRVVRLLNPESPIPKDIHLELDAALAAQDPKEALRMLLDLRKRGAELASLDYLIATRAVQAGDIRLARRAAQDSIEKFQRVAESATLLSVLVPPKDAMGLLARAAAADTANPLPYLSVLMRLRAAGDREGAAQALRALRLRLLPVEPALVAGPLEALFTLEGMPDESLPERAPRLAAGDSRWAEAYLAMRRGRPEAAAAVLRELRAETPPHLFYFMANDPAFRPFLNDPLIREQLPFAPGSSAPSQQPAGGLLRPAPDHSKIAPPRSNSSRTAE